MKKPVLALAGVASAAALLAGCGGGSKPGNAAVYERISNETDCTALQAEFNAADANHSRDLKVNLDRAKIDTAYMEAAQKQMEEVGC